MLNEHIYLSALPYSLRGKLICYAADGSCAHLTEVGQMILLCAGSWNTCGAATGVLLVQREGSGTLFRQQHHTP